MTRRPRDVSGASRLDDAHEWISFEDPDFDRTWVFDVTFLLSGWSCIYGSGCQGVLTEATPELEQGCCSYGAEFGDDDDARKIEREAQRLSADQWQHRAQGRARGVIKRLRNGNAATRLVDDACIFLNRPGFPGGAGCALHRAALERGDRPLDHKPEVCWSLPLHRSDEVADDGHVTATVRQWRRRDWGSGGADFHWWCTEASEAFAGRDPVYRTMGEELAAITGDAVYALLVAYLDERAAGTSVALPHPVVRRAERA